MSAAPIVTVFLRPGCHLCGQALETLARIQQDLPFALESVDIESEAALHARYLERIPVVTLAGDELYDFFVDEADLRLRLAPRGAR